jgi:hypothetical protein
VSRGELPTILVRAADDREEREAAEEGDVGRVAVRQEMDEAEERGAREERVARDPLHTPRLGTSGHDRGGARADEAADGEHERNRHSDVDDPEDGAHGGERPELRAGVLVPEVHPYERNE